MICFSDLHRARTRHDDEFVAADLAAIDADLRSPGPELLADELVGRGNAHRLLHLRHGFHRFQASGDVAHADHADHDALFAFDGVDLVAEIADALAHLVDLLPAGMQFHRNDHLLSRPKIKNPLFRVGRF